MKALGWIVLSCSAACGSSGGSADAPVSVIADAPIDAFVDHPCVPTSASGSATVALPADHATSVLVHDASGALKSRRDVEVDEVDAVEVAVASCDTVTLVRRQPLDAIYTWLDVAPGAHLGDAGSGSATHDVEVTIPPLASATEYDVEIHCGTSGIALESGDNAPGPWTVIVRQCAAADTTLSVVVAARTPAGNQYAVAAAVPIASGTTHVAPGPYAPVQTIAPVVHHVGLGDRGFANSYAVPEVSPFRIATASDSFLGTGDDALISPLPVPPGRGQLEVGVQRYTSGARVYTSLRRTFAAPPSTLEIDAADFLPAPWLSLDGDDAPFTLHWGIDPAPHTTRAILGLQLDGGADWLVYAPPTPREIHLPALPADLALPPGRPQASISVVDEPAAGDARAVSVTP